jgi:hypothetical protein
MAINIRTRYAAAVHSANLTVKNSKNSTDEAETVIGDPEILGAHGLADKYLTRGYVDPERTFSPAPLAVPLERLFAGDARAVYEIVRILADLAMEQSYAMGIQIKPTEVADMSRAVIAWFRHGVCKPCGGRGFPILKDTPVMSAHACDGCKGTGKIPFDRNFRHEWKPLARWMKERIQAESGRAGPNAMKALATKFEL